MQHRKSSERIEPRPELAEFFNDLLIAIDDERQRRAHEARDIQWMMQHGDRPAPWHRKPRSGWSGAGGADGSRIDVDYRDQADGSSGEGGH